jgi:uncharacterized protein YggE
MDGTGSEGDGAAALPRLPPETAQNFIIIDGRAEMRVRPTEIRVVIAVTSEAETAQKCQERVSASIERLKTAWSKMGIAPENIVADFIAVIPRYQWDMEKSGEAVEKRVGYRMQTNVHVAVQKESDAQAVVTRAFEQGIADVLAFDYWSKDLDEMKVKAREQALKTARSKADTLLGALFHEQPPVVNLQEQTKVYYPESLYHTVAASAEDTVEEHRSEIAYIHAYRPQHTYYRGLFSNSDVQPRELPMHPEISVVSTVRLYFKSPVSGKIKHKTSVTKGGHRQDSGGKNGGGLF